MLFVIQFNNHCTHWKLVWKWNRSGNVVAIISTFVSETGFMSVRAILMRIISSFVVRASVSVLVSLRNAFKWCVWCALCMYLCVYVCTDVQSNKWMGTFAGFFFSFVLQKWNGAYIRSHPIWSFSHLRIHNWMSIMRQFDNDFFSFFTSFFLSPYASLFLLLSPFFFFFFALNHHSEPLYMCNGIIFSYWE